MVKKSERARLIHLVLLAIGFGWMMVTALNQGLKPKEVSWLFWTASFLISPVLLIISQLERIYRPDSKNSMRKRLFMAFMAALAGGVAIYFVHLIAGAFLSVVAEIEPAYFFGRNGFINHFSPDAWWILLERYWILIPAYLTVKSSGLVVSPQARMMGHGTLRDPILSLFAVAISAFFSLHLFWSLLVFGLIFFAPWSLIVSKDITAKRRDREPDLNPPVQFPVDFTDRASRFWGAFITAFGSIFLAVGIWFPFYMLSESYGQVGSILASLIFMLVFAGFAALSMLFGLTMLFRYRLIRIDEANVWCEERRITTKVQTKKWQQSILSYRLLKDQIHHRDTDGINYEEYLVLLKHSQSSEFDVTLYRAYHEEGWEEKFQAWQKLISRAEP